MERVTGIGGVFLRGSATTDLRAWYAEHLGIELTEWGTRTYEERKGSTTFALFDHDSTYVGGPEQAVMINFTVDDLDAMLAQLRDAGATTDPNVEDSEHGRFGWVTDPAGNRIELWQPA